MLPYAFLAAKILQSNLQRLPAPYRLTFILTYKCNFRCRVCNIWKREQRQEMSTQEIERFFSRNRNIVWLNLAGGEIFLRSDLKEIAGIVYRKLRNLAVLDFATTGFFTDETLSFAYGLKRYRPRRVFITVSLDGPPQLHERLRGVQGSWENAIETFKGLRRLRPYNIFTYFGYTLNSENTGAFFDTVREAESAVPGIGLGDFHLNLAQTSAFYYKNDSSLDRDWHLSQRRALSVLLRQARRARKGGSPVVSFLERAYQKNLEKFLEDRKTPLACKALSASCCIDPYWNVYPCISYDRPLANLKENDFDLKGIWGSKKARRARADIAQGRCPQCWTPCEAYQTILGNVLSNMLDIIA